MICKICDNSAENRSYQVREMMFGYREWFAYFQCARCGCLQIAEIPPDMSKYYPPTYYSLMRSPAEPFKNPIRKVFKKLRDRYAVFGKGIIGRWLYKKYPAEHFLSLSNVPGLTRQTRILDVGCGSGTLLYALKEDGFTSLVGVDPFIEEDMEYGNGLQILKKDIHELSGEWDVTIFHHVFEHLAEPLQVLHAVARILSPEGMCLIRTPAISSYAWEHYGVNWVQLDAPRHFFVHSAGSLQLLASKAGLSLCKTVYDSTDFQFWGSEQYLKDIPLASEQSYAVNPAHSIFSQAEIATFKQKAKTLNLEGRGDSATFYLRKNSRL